MKEEIMQRIAAVLNALNHVYVMGKPNLDNLTGSIAVVEEIGRMLEQCEITDTRKDGQEDAGKAERR